jgi:hypothetical protein
VLDIFAVAAHVPLADGTLRARNRIRSPNDADHEVSGNEAATVGRFDDTAERFMPEFEPVTPSGAAPYVPARISPSLG